ncbi:MAG: hypothetical protein B5M53_08360 [Candidatus Cloacimonas sp. 4484_209]|nr:MAG: hypothetical protein B5M53_08360 [Candidatus Cloacimonas sp. 4484_209]
MLSIEMAYENTNGWSAYQGVILKDGFDEYLSSRVRPRFYDIEGTEALIEEFKDTTSTGFEKQLLIDIFSTSPSIEDWKIGEALAECYLEDFEKVRFYYPSSRDAKNPKANLQGADLVGFIDIDGVTTIFLFGEVKTSGDKNSPPQVMYGRSGMIDQLRTIKNNPDLQRALIKWLGFKVKDLSDNDPFKKDYRKALKVYLKEQAEHRYFLFGILIRDTQPKDTDLKSRHESLKNDLSAGTQLKLIALYIPMPIKDMKDYIIEDGE